MYRNRLAYKRVAVAISTQDVHIRLATVNSEYVQLKLFISDMKSIGSTVRTYTVVSEASQVL